MALDDADVVDCRPAAGRTCERIKRRRYASEQGRPTWPVGTRNGRSIKAGWIQDTWSSSMRLGAKTNVARTRAGALRSCRRIAESMAHAGRSSSPLAYFKHVLAPPVLGPGSHSSLRQCPRPQRPGRPASHRDVGVRQPPLQLRIRFNPNRSRSSRCSLDWRSAWMARAYALDLRRGWLRRSRPARPAGRWRRCSRSASPV